MKKAPFAVLIFLLLLIAIFVNISKVRATTTEDLWVTYALPEDIPREPMPENFTAEDYLNTTNPYSNFATPQGALAEVDDPEGNKPLYVLVFGDEEERAILRGGPSFYYWWNEWAEWQIERGDESLVANFGIDIRILGFLEWDSNDSLDSMYDLWYELESDTNQYLRTWYDGEDWSDYVDAIIGITAQETTDNIAGLSPGDDYLDAGRIFTLLKWQVHWMDDNLVQHEVSHLYYADDHYYTCCAMAYHTHFQTLIWEDGLWWVFANVPCLYTAYSWCTSCHQTIQQNSWRYCSGCPYVYTWDGQQYVMDNNLLSASEMSHGADVEDYYMLEQPLVPTHQGTLFSLYSLQIREFEQEHDFIDRVKLLAVDHKSDVDVAATPDGEVLTYKNPHPPISCTNKYGYNVLDKIQYIDQDYYQGFPDDYLTLDFGNLSVQEGAKLVMRADMEHVKDSIHVQILNETSEWQTVAKIIPRVYWATEIVNLAPYLPNSTSSLQIRLYFTSFHKLDYVGLDTTPQAEITIRQSLLISAIHSEKGLITLKLLFNDQNYAELTPNQQINLLFALPQKQDQTTTTTFIFYTNGHYNTIK